jgi:hypothetical protein
MGNVDNSGDAALIGTTAYHYAAFPDSDGICIVKRDIFPETMGAEAAEYGDAEGYAFYTFDGKGGTDGLSGKEILQSYGLSSETVSDVEVYSASHTPLKSITDETQITQLLDVIAENNVNIGLESHNELWQVWIDSLENPDKRHDMDELYQREIIITSARGFDLYIMYNAHLKTLCVLNSFFELTDESTAKLDSLLSVNR